MTIDQMLRRVGMHHYYSNGNWRLWRNHRPLLEFDFRRRAFAMEISRYNDDYGSHNSLHLHFLWPNIFITLPGRYPEEPYGSFGRSWGMSIPDAYAIHFNWGDKTKIYWSPWNWESVRNEVQRADGSWSEYFPEYGKYNKELKTWIKGEPDGRHVTDHIYTYILRSGEKQVVNAQVYVERSFLRQRWLKWTRLFERETRSINVTFSDGVGERAGSWKGGCIGCSYSMFPGETVEQCLRRMEKERKFR